MSGTHTTDSGMEYIFKNWQTTERQKDRKAHQCELWIVIGGTVQLHINKFVSTADMFDVHFESIEIPNWIFLTKYDSIPISVRLTIDQIIMDSIKSGAVFGSRLKLSYDCE